MITRQKAYTLRQLILKVSKYLDDSDALDGIELFPKWKADGSYEVGDRVSFEGILLLGDKVSHNGKHWESMIDFNVYEPSVVGENIWKEV